MNKTTKLILLGLFIAQSLVLYIIEGMLPVPFIAPGAKLGLSNLITVVALYTFPRRRDTACILLIRIILATAFAGGINAFLYSLAGAAFSFTAMALLMKTEKFSRIGVSAPAAFYIIGARFSQHRSLWKMRSFSSTCPSSPSPAPARGFLSVLRRISRCAT